MSTRPPPEPRPSPEARGAYRWFCPITTRWMDNDAYGHVNNVVYYAWFDTAINRFLVSQGGLSIADSPDIGLCVESGCTFAAPVTYPNDVVLGLRVAHLGRSSVRYEVGVFEADGPVAAAQGFFVHVFVDRVTRRASALPHAIRAALQSIAGVSTG